MSCKPTAIAEETILFNIDCKFDIDPLKRAISSAKRRSEELNEKLEKWKYRMPRTIDYSKKNNFFDLGNSLWYQICMGMNILNSDVAKKELMYYNLYERAKQDLQKISDYSDNYIENTISTNEYYKKL